MKTIDPLISETDPPDGQPESENLKPNEDTQRLVAAFELAPIGMSLVSKGGQFLRVNRAFSALIGYSEAELVALDFQTLTHPDDLEADLKLTHQLLDGEMESFQMEKRYLHREGHWIWALLSTSLVSDDQGKPLYFISQIQDISVQRQAEDALQAAKQQLKDANHELALANQELLKLAHDDGLTGLKNRRSFDERLREEVARSRRTKVGFSLVLLDIDHFKNINDNWGHTTGDEVLRQLARLLTETLRVVDIIARYGGEEFAIILPSTGSLGSYRAAERCRESIANYAWSHGPVTASCGVATWNDEDEQTLLVRADLALYSAKQSGRNRVQHAQFQTQN
jgi:diguanylate cyclase (GGDEF)-like protein/PAS domain S-box-containing protein